jgi:DEAD/DEAH box helicase domain-containing protein
VLTNPDMLSAGVLPRHAEWGRFLAGLRIVVIDEAHVYRGVFGSHVAQVLRRLRRLCAEHGSVPVFVCTSGTIANPAEHAEALTGVEAAVVGDHGAPSAGRDLALWNPEADEQDGTRASPLGDAARAYSLLVEEGVPTIVFARTRRSCELIHRFARDRLLSRDRADLANRIAPYRAGYTPEERRATERALARGELLGVVATNALELGIDIGSLEASISVTFPGTVTSLRQQWGRAGRGSVRGFCMLIAGPDALDQYFAAQPRSLLERPDEQAVVSLTNPRIATPHIAAAACELPLNDFDRQLFGGALSPAIEQLEGDGLLAHTPAGAAYIGKDHPAGSISLRSGGAGNVIILEQDTGVVLGTVEAWRAPGTLYPGAVYLHRGDSYIVHELDLDTAIATVSPRTLDYYTLPKVDTDITVIESLDRRDIGGVDLHHGLVEVHEQVVGFQRKSVQSHRVIDLVHRQLPPQDFLTEAIWFAAPEQAIDDIGPADLLGALHAAEHGMIAMLPLIAMCDRNDIGGLSIDWHAEFTGPGIFVYDGHHGGVGITRAGFDAFIQWIDMTITAIDACRCEDGCPSCVQSPKCGNLNEPLHKLGALVTLRSLLDRVPGGTRA